MSKELRVIAWCDHPDHEDPMEASQERRVKLDDHPLVTLDLCAGHDLELRPVWALIETGTVVHKRAADKATSAPRKQQHDPSLPAQYRTCPLCGFVSSTRGALGSHLRKLHDRKISEFPDLKAPYGTATK